MKTSAVLASLFFGSFAVAVPLHHRDVVTTTQIVTETVVVYTTVYDDEPAPTSSQGLFYEQPAPSSVAAYSTPAAPAYTPPAPVVASQAYTPVPQAPAPTPQAPSSAAYVAPAPTPVAPAPAPVAPAPSSAAYVAPAAPAPSKPSTNNNQAADAYTNVDVTIYNGNGDLGACGNKIIDTELTAAIGPGAWGKSTYDVMTGAATNPMCGQKIQVTLNGRSVIATVQDLCPGCLGPNDVDLTMGAFQIVTGSQEITRYHGASWSKVY